jgi:hypothetical protein
LKAADESEAPQHIFRWDRVAVRVEADERGLVDVDGHDDVGVERRHRRCEQPATLLLEAVSYGPPGDRWVWSLVGDLLDEGKELPIPVVDAVKRAATKEAIAHIADGSFHPALLVGLAWHAQTRLNAVMTGDVEERRVEPDRITAPLDDNRLRIVEQPLPRRSTEPCRAAAQRAGEGLGAAQ